ncbi:MAG: class I SAM-dependent methyltransferase [Solirubrobacteraceae bacterium]
MVWHDLECGGYAQDRSLWRALAAKHGDPILDVGAGTGRVALDLARLGHRVTALDRDPALLAELSERAHRAGCSPVRTVLADARSFELGCRFALCVVPMQTIQLLGGPGGRREFLQCARAQLRAEGVLAVAIAEALEPYRVPEGSPYPPADVCELDGFVYSSQPIAIRIDRGGFVLERRRETTPAVPVEPLVSVDGARAVEHDLILLDRLSAEQLEREALGTGMSLAGRLEIPATRDHVGSTVVMLHS